MSFFKRKKRQLEEMKDCQTTDSNAELVSSNLEENMDKIKSRFGISNDIIYKKFLINGKTNAGLVYVDGLVNKDYLQDFVLKVTMYDKEITVDPKSKKNDYIQYLKEEAITIGELFDSNDLTIIFNHILSGETAIFIDGIDTCLIASIRGWEHRDVSEPTTQNVIRGPKEAFTESIRTNTSLIRRKIKDPDLRINTKIIGKRTNTDVSVIYLESVVNMKVVDEVLDRLNQIDIDGILESAYIEELIEDNSASPFPTMMNSERPDVVAAALLEGRVAIIVDGTPFVLIVPSLFINYFQSPEDYYERSFFGLIRVLRFLSFFMALLVPSIYIALTTFHQEMIPTELLIDLAAQREGIPFPALIEALIMEITFEVLREAGIRMPRAVGQAISIVGALVLGQAAVQAGLVSPTMVIVVSITAISNFVFPAYDMAISVRILRFGFMILSATFGLFGIAVGLFVLFLHLCSLRSFGVPYMAPLGPIIYTDQQDAIIRFPRKLVFTRPRLISPNSIKQQRYNTRYGRKK